MSQAPRHTLVPIFLPHLGCDQRCIYCNQSFITASGAQETLISQIEARLSGRTEPVEIALYSGNLFGIPIDQLLDLFAVLENYRNLISSIRISTKPVPLNGRIVDILKERNVRVIELGMPCFNDDILASLNRGYSISDFLRSYRYLESQGFVLGLQVMVGLPGETENDVELTSEYLSLLRPPLLRIYPLVVLEGTTLHGLYRNGQFHPLGLDEAVARTALLYLNALRHKIKVIRMGLSDNDVLHEHVIAGPYHPAFGFLVKARVFVEAVTAAWKELGQPSSLGIRLNSKDIPHLIGHRRSHIERFRELGVQLLWRADKLEQGCFVAESETRAVQRSVAGSVMVAECRERVS